LDKQVVAPSTILIENKSQAQFGMEMGAACCLINCDFEPKQVQPKATNKQ
jgi:hypothetical protein